MNKESKPSLFLPHFAAVLFTLIFLSGITEFVVISAYAQKNNYSVFTEIASLFSKSRIQQVVYADNITSDLTYIYDKQENGVNEQQH